jgi:hypothetical protein
VDRARSGRNVVPGETKLQLAKFVVHENAERLKCSRSGIDARSLWEVDKTTDRRAREQLTRFLTHKYADEDADTVTPISTTTKSAITDHTTSVLGFPTHCTTNDVRQLSSSFDALGAPLQADAVRNLSTESFLTILIVHE